MAKETEVLGWHFLRDNSQTNYGENKLVTAGTVLEVPAHAIKSILPCVYGYHLSELPLDALYYAPGMVLCRVKGSGAMLSHKGVSQWSGKHIDKWACQRRECLWKLSKTRTRRVLRIFARHCALSVAHLIPDLTERQFAWLLVGGRLPRVARPTSRAGGALFYAATGYRYGAREAAIYASVTWSEKARPTTSAERCRKERKRYEAFNRKLERMLEAERKGTLETWLPCPNNNLRKRFPALLKELGYE